MDARDLRGVGMCLRSVFWRWMAMNRAQVAAIERGLCGSLPQRRERAVSCRAFIKRFSGSELKEAPENGDPRLERNRIHLEPRLALDMHPGGHNAAYGTDNRFWRHSVPL